MAEMTLRMMIAAGVLDEVPAAIVQDGNPYNRVYARRTGHGFQHASVNPYSTGLNDPYYGDSLLGSTYGYGGYNDYSPYRSLYGRLLHRDPYSTLDSYRLYNNPLSVAPYGRRYRPWGYGYRSYGYGGRYPYGYGYTRPWGVPGGGTWGGLWNRRGVSPYSYYPGSYYNSWSSPWANPWSGGWPGLTLSPSSAVPGNGYHPAQSAALLPMTGVPELSAAGRNPWSGHVPDYRSVPVHSGPLLQWRQSLVRPYVTTGRIPLGYGDPEPAVQARHLPPNTADAANPPPFDWDAASAYQPAQDDTPNIFSEQLEGLWVTEDGEYLGLRGNEFLWTDGSELYEKGTISATADTLIAHSDGSSSPVSYRYRLGEDELMTVGQDGKTRQYRRIPIEEGVAMLPEEEQTQPGKQLLLPPSTQQEQKLRQ